MGGGREGGGRFLFEFFLFVVNFRLLFRLLHFLTRTHSLSLFLLSSHPPYIVVLFSYTANPTTSTTTTTTTFFSYSNCNTSNSSNSNSSNNSNTSSTINTSSIFFHLPV